MAKSSGTVCYPFFLKSEDDGEKNIGEKNYKH